MKKKALLALGSLAATVAVLPLFAAFEAHVVNVTARIENAMRVPLTSIDFGTIFPQEHFDKPLDLHLSQSFLDEGRVDGVDYFIRQKPKCAITTKDGGQIVGPTATGEVIATTTSDVGYVIDCGPSPRQLTENEIWGVLPSLCPYLSKHPDNVNDLQQPSTNDQSLNSFHIPFSIVSGTVAWNQTNGQLSKNQNDENDIWKIDVAAPCFGGQCAQDWASFVHGINPDVNPADYVQPGSNEHKVFGCDLWVEVSGIHENIE